MLKKGFNSLVCVYLLRDFSCGKIPLLLRTNFIPNVSQHEEYEKTPISNFPTYNSFP